MVFELMRNSLFRFTIFDEDGNILSPNNTSTRNDAGVKRELSYSSRSQQPSATETDENPGTRSRRVISSHSDTEAEEHHAPHEEAGPSSNCKTEQLPATSCKRRRLRKIADIGKGQAQGDTNPANPNESPGGSGVDTGQPHQSVPEPLVNLQGTKSPFDPLNPLALTILSRRRPVMPVERQRAKDSAEAHAAQVTTTSPNFLVVITDAHVYRGFRLVSHPCHQNITY